MRLVINLILIALIGVLIWVLYSSIQEPIEFKNVMDTRKDAVVKRLVDIRKGQELHRDITGKFAGSFDSLFYVLRNGKKQIISVYGNPDDPEDTTIRYDTTYEDARQIVQEMGLNLDSMAYVPFSGGKRFEIDADTVTYQQTLVYVTEVSTTWKSFMGKWGSERYSQYDDSYDPNAKLKFGNMGAPNLAGNWEN